MSKVLTMDEEGFIAFMKKERKSERAIQRYCRYMKTFEEYLIRNGKSLESVSPQDIEDFISWGAQSLKVNQYLWGLKVYFEYTSNEMMEMTATVLIGERYMVQSKLKDFRGVAPEHIEKLAFMGIKTPKDMLNAGKTEKGRIELAKKSEISSDSITELVKLSDLSRIPGLKTVRARLYHDAGADTVEKLAEWDPEELRGMLIKFIETTGFEGVAPLPKEVRSTVATARYLQKIVEY
jgi:predicted flap endonuclease-1-like 5' DNA nuclease